MSGQAIYPGMRSAAKRLGFTLDEARAAGVEFPRSPGRTGWARDWAAAAHKEVARWRSEQLRAEAIRQARKMRDRREAEPIWAVVEQWGSYSWSGCYYGRRVVRPSRGKLVGCIASGLTYAEAVALVEADPRKEEARKNSEDFRAFLDL